MSNPLTPGPAAGGAGPEPSYAAPTEVGPAVPAHDAGTSLHDHRHETHHTPHHDTGTSEHFGDVKVAAGGQSAYVTLELILWALATLGIFVTAAVVDEDGGIEGFSASEAWFYVTLLTVGLIVSRGLAKMGHRGTGGTRTL
jgi:hypothetical protein